MSTERRMRASDSDRDRVAELLRDAYAVGRLNHDEFRERSAAAYSARTLGELHDLTIDLPATRAASLPADIVMKRAVARGTHRRCVKKSWACVLVLTAALTGQVVHSAVWTMAAMAALVLVIQVRFR